MKSKRSVVSLALLVAFFFTTLCVVATRADSEDPNAEFKKKRAETIAAQVRPSGVAEKDWIAISPNAGYAITRYVSPLVIETELYLKTERGWCRAFTSNPVSPQLLGK